MKIEMKDSEILKGFVVSDHALFNELIATNNIAISESILARRQAIRECLASMRKETTAKED